MAAPVVRDLQSTIADLTKANQGQYDLLNKDNAALDTSAQQQEQGLAAKQNTAFQGITANAQDRGALFSGFTPDAQAKYTSDTYLPALASLQQAITASRRQIQGQQVDLGTKINDQAAGLVEGDKTALQKWQETQDALLAQQQEAQKQRDFEATQAQAKAAQDAETLRQQQAFEGSQTTQKLRSAEAIAASDRAAAAANASAKTNADKLSASQALTQMFSKYDPNVKSNFTETYVIPTLAKEYNLPKYDPKKNNYQGSADQFAYDYRKQFFGQ